MPRHEIERRMTIRRDGVLPVLLAGALLLSGVPARAAAPSSQDGHATGDGPHKRKVARRKAARVRADRAARRARQKQSRKSNARRSSRRGHRRPAPPPPAKKATQAAVPEPETEAAVAGTESMSATAASHAVNATQTSASRADDTVTITHSRAPAHASWLPDALVELDIAAGPMVRSRSLRYRDDASGLRPYEMPAAVAAGGAVVLYPRLLQTAVADLRLDGGVAGSFEWSFTRSSYDPDDVQYGTIDRAWSLGARMRAALGTWQVSLGADFGAHDFVLSKRPDGTPAPVPNVRYRYLRALVHARIPIAGSVDALGEAAVLPVFGAGEIAGDDYFPRATALGFEGSAGVGYALGAGLEARATGALKRFSFDMHAAPGDPMVTGGAVDQFLSGSLWLAWRI